VGRGDWGEIPRCDLAQSVATLIFSEPDRLKVRSRDRDCLAALLTCQNPRSMLGYMMSDRDNPLLPLVATLKSEGTIPDQVISDPGIFLTVAKHGYHCSDTQTLIGLLYRSARHWKSRYETLEKALDEATSSRFTKEDKKDLLDICRSLIDLCGSLMNSRDSREQEINRLELKLMKESVENVSLSHQLENMHWLVSSSQRDTIRMLKGLDKFTDPELIKLFITAELGLLGGFNIIFSSYNSLF
jgi:hypothetical protein